MRLINTQNFIIQEFFESDIPRHAILSHTWAPKGATYQDWLYVTRQALARWG